MKKYLPIISLLLLSCSPRIMVEQNGLIFETNAKASKNLAGGSTTMPQSIRYNNQIYLYTKMPFRGDEACYVGQEQRDTLVFYMPYKYKLPKEK